jgi:hypothetical protein
LKERRFDLVRSRNAVVPLASVLAIVLSGTSFASADELVVHTEPVAIYVVLLPLVGAILLLLVALPPLLRRPYWRETPAFHVANTVTVTSVITLLMAFVAFFLVYETSGDRSATVAASAVMATLILAGILVRYLLVPLPWATGTAVLLAFMLVALIKLALDSTSPYMLSIVGTLLYVLPLLLLIWVGLLAWETARFHHVEGKTHEEPEGPRLPPRRRMLRLGELLIANMAVAVGLLLILPS